MKILVCIKQVPGSSNVEVDPVTGVLKRSGIQSKMNPYDLYALECALTLAEKYGFEEILETKAGCTVSSHCGPECLGVLFFTK